jgi:hypothetical protein
MSFLVTLACSAPGGIVYLLYRPSRGMGAVNLSEMEREVATLEQRIVEKEG